MSNLVSTLLSASGVAHAGECHLTSIHANGSGVIEIYNGSDDTGFLAASFSLPNGFSSIEEAPFSWRLNKGCYVKFASFAGSATFSFC